MVEEEFIQEKKQSIIRNSDEKKEFVCKLKCRVGSIVTSSIISCETLKSITQEFAFIIKNFWNKYSKLVNITKRSKAW